MVLAIQTADGQNTWDSTGESLYLWGAQLEVGSFPTSYIKTTSASVTRNGDVAVMTGTDFSDWYNATEGSVYSLIDWQNPQFDASAFDTFFQWVIFFLLFFNIALLTFSMRIPIVVDIIFCKCFCLSTDVTSFHI
jgi:hypothetical protein